MIEPVVIPITRELHRNRRKVVVVSFAVILVSVSVFLGLSLNSEATINVMGIQVQISYPATSQKVLGNDVQNFSWNFKTLSSGEDFHFSFQITNHGNVSDTIHWIGIANDTNGFEILSMTEPVPMNVEPHSTINLTLTIKAPNHDFAGILVILISTVPITVT